MFFVFQTVSAQTPQRAAGGLLANAARRGAQEGTLNRAQAERVVQHAQDAQREVRMPMREQTRIQPPNPFQNQMQSLRSESGQRLEQNEFANKSPCGAGGCGGCNGCRSFSKEDVQNYIEFSNERPQLSMEGGLKIEPKVGHQTPFHIQNFAINPDILKRFHEEEDRRKELLRGRSNSPVFDVAAKIIEVVPPANAETGKDAVPVQTEALAGGNVNFAEFSKQSLSILESAPEIKISGGAQKIMPANDAPGIVGRVSKKEEKSVSDDAAIRRKSDVLIGVTPGILITESRLVPAGAGSSAAKTGPIKQVRVPVIKTLSAVRPSKTAKSSKSVAKTPQTPAKMIRDTRTEKQRNQSTASVKAKPKKAGRANEAKRRIATTRTHTRKLEKENAPARTKDPRKRRSAPNLPAETPKRNKARTPGAKTHAEKPAPLPKNKPKAGRNLHSREKTRIRKGGPRASSKTKNPATEKNAGRMRVRTPNAKKQAPIAGKRPVSSAVSQKANRSRKGGRISAGIEKKDRASKPVVLGKAA
ncbi:MAG: hypothetical protein M1530_01130 [Candidatus Marsarchaeota archaeon]|nr:hypothetical protein [Candidatus Marsarchaeota archaeon]